MFYPNNLARKGLISIPGTEMNVKVNMDSW